MGRLVYVGVSVEKCSLKHSAVTIEDAIHIPNFLVDYRYAKYETNSNSNDDAKIKRLIFQHDYSDNDD